MNNIPNNYNPGVNQQYEDMLTRQYEQQQSMQHRAAAASMGNYGYMPHPQVGVQEQFIPVQSAIPLKKRSPSMYMNNPSLHANQHQMMMQQHSMNQDLATRKRMLAATSSSAALTSQAQGQANPSEFSDLQQSPQAQQPPKKKSRPTVSTESSASASANGNSNEDSSTTLAKATPGAGAGSAADAAGEVNLAEKPVTRNNPTKIPPCPDGLDSYATDDVLSGRGGGTNSHPGNRFFRNLINHHRDRYLRAKKNDKPHISRSIVNIIRNKNGRFLKKEEEDGLWYEIGDDLAREKTSQALRQKAPEHRRIMEEQDQIARERFAVMPTLPPQMHAPVHPQLSGAVGVPVHPMVDGHGHGGMMGRRVSAAESMMDGMPVPGVGVPGMPPLHPHDPSLHQGQPGSPDDELMMQYIALKRRQQKIQRQIMLVNEIKQMKEQMLMY